MTDRHRGSIIRKCACGRTCLTSYECVRRREKRGLPWRCRSCAMRERAATCPRSFPPHVRDRAVLLRTRGYGPKDIARHLAEEGYRVASNTISVWTSARAA